MGSEPRGERPARCSLTVPSHLGGRQDADRWGSPRGFLRPLQPPPAPHPGVSARQEGGGRDGSAVSRQWTGRTPASVPGTTDAYPGQPTEAAGRMRGHGTDGETGDGQGDAGQSGAGWTGWMRDSRGRDEGWTRNAGQIGGRGTDRSRADGVDPGQTGAGCGVDGGMQDGRGDAGQGQDVGQTGGGRGTDSGDTERRGEAAPAQGPGVCFSPSPPGHPLAAGSCPEAPGAPRPVSSQRPGFADRPAVPGALC